MLERYFNLHLSVLFWFQNLYFIIKLSFSKNFLKKINLDQLKIKQIN